MYLEMLFLLSNFGVSISHTQIIQKQYCDVLKDSCLIIDIILNY